MAPKHVPERMCAVCRARAPKRELVRIVWDGSALALDLGGKRPGRGAYVGPLRSCWSDAGLAPKLQRALQVTFGPDDRATLAAIAAGCPGGGAAGPRGAALPPA